MTGELFEVSDSMLKVVSLDGHRISIRKIELKENYPAKKVIVPGKTLVEISKILAGHTESMVNIFFTSNHIVFQFDKTTVVSRLIEGEYVKYKHILPTNFENVVTVNKNALLNSIERASIVARNDRYNVVKFDIKEDIMTVSAKSEVGNVNENVNIMLSGKDIQIAFNGKYLAEYLKIVNDEFIVLNLNTPIDPCIITAVGNEGFLYLVLPVRINA
jgi:DNA polymerase-3 subunit beta